MANVKFSSLAKGTYVNTTAYTVADIVDYSGSSYACIANTTGNLPTNTTYWALLASKGSIGIQGIQGIPGTIGLTGTSFIWKGAYSTSTAYVVNDNVSYGGSSYICILDSTGNLPTNTTYWSLLALAGAGIVGSVVGPLVMTGSALSIPVATSTANGYLSSADWTTFNAKEPALGNPATDGDVLSSTIAGVRSWVAVSSGSPAGVNAGINVQTLTANITLTAGTDPMYQYLDISTQGLIVTLATAGASAGDRFVIRDTYSGTTQYYSNINQGTTKIEQLRPEVTKTFIFDGTNWKGADNGTGGDSVTIGNGAVSGTRGVGIGANSVGYSDGVSIGFGSFGFTMGVGIGRNAIGANYGVAVGSYANGSSYGAAVGSYANGNNYGSALGVYAGNGQTGSQNINIGQYVTSPTLAGNQQLNIGNVLYGTGMYAGATVSSVPVAGGMIGIGKVPTQALDVVGNGLFSGTLTASNLSGTNTGDQNLTPYALLTGATFTGLVKMPSFQLGSTSTAGYVLTTDINGVGTWQAGGGTGTVTSVSIVTANGVSGTVATATSTPAITLSLGTITPTTVNALTLASQTTGFTIAGGTTSETLTVDGAFVVSTQLSAISLNTAKVGITTTQAGDITTNNAKVGVTTQISTVLEDTTPQLGGQLDAQANSIGFTRQTYTGTTTSTTIDFTKGNKVSFTFGAGNETLVFTAPAKDGTFILNLIQDSVGGRTVTFPTTVKWAGGTAPTLSTAAGARDKVALDWDGTQYDAVMSANFA